MTDILRREFDYYTVEAKLEKFHVDFTIYEGIGYLEAFEEQVKRGIDFALGPNYESDPLVKGYVKWDGCSNWDFYKEEGTSHPLHFCGQSEAQSFGELFPILYDWAAELFPSENDYMTKNW